MKQLSKMMLAAVASVALAAPAFAWDFSASGSSSATFSHKTTNSGVSGAKDDIENHFTSSAGGVTVSSSHADGGNSATFSYTADWNGDAGNFDEYVSVSGSKKVGNWTASSGTTQHIQKDVTGNASPMTAGNSAVITLTDGSITYKLGNAVHLSTAEKAVNGPMGGAQDAEADVDAFDGFSVGLGVGPGTLTVAIGEDHDGTVLMGGEQGMAIAACESNSLQYGLNFSGDVGVDLAFTYASGSNTANPLSCTTDNASNETKGDSATANTMGLGIAVPIGGMTLALDYESSATTNKTGVTGTDVETKTTGSGFEVSFTMPIADATIGINISAHATETQVDATVTALGAQAGTEVWYSVPIGAVTLAVGYGSSASATGCSTCGAGGTDAEVVTAAVTEMGAEMSMSF